MKIILCRTGNSAEEQLIEALKQAGAEIIDFQETIKEINYDKEYLGKILALYDKEQPQLFWSIEFLPIVSRACQALKIPYISWATEKSYVALYSETVKNPVNYIFVAEETLYERIKEINTGHIFYLPLGHICKDRAVETGVVLNLSKTEINNYALKQEGSQYLWGYVKGIVEAQRRIYGASIIEKLITEEVENEFKATVYRSRLGSDYMEEPVKYLMDDFICDTITDLEREKAKTEITADFLQEGNAEHIGEINVFITNRRWKKGIPFEATSIMASGGFLLVNYQDSLEEYFEIDEELVIFEDFEDLKKKIKYYKEHENERNKIAKKGQKAIKERFSLIEQVKDIFYLLEKN